MLDFSVELSLGRELLFNVGNLIGRYCHENYPLSENGPKWLILKFLNPY